jgi:hypothetical protein
LEQTCQAQQVLEQAALGRLPLPTESIQLVTKLLGEQKLSPTASGLMTALRRQQLQQLIREQNFSFLPLLGLLLFLLALHHCLSEYGVLVVAALVVLPLLGPCTMAVLEGAVVLLKLEYQG